MPRTFRCLLAAGAVCALLSGRSLFAAADPPDKTGTAGQPPATKPAPEGQGIRPGQTPYDLWPPPYPYPPWPLPYPYQGYPPAGGTISSTPTQPYAVPPTGLTRKAYIRVFLPDDRARVTLDGYETRGTGASRLFETPPLEMGQTYTYTVRATWTRHGRTVTQERRVVVAPGQYAVANFNLPAPSEPIPGPPYGPPPYGPPPYGR
ncbi:MAG TPA: TIGR03000 domain-containing protein [Gemmataceae bacterium]|nr:TIGR03000 domain-containing protein [Gemmataceae bacterium]